MSKRFMAAAVVAVATGLPAAASADQGAVVVRDPATGALRAPTAAEAAALRAPAAATALRGASSVAAQRSAAEPRVIQRADGSFQATLPDSMMVHSVVRRQADGSLVRQCIQDEAQAQASMLPEFAERVKTTSAAARSNGGIAHADR